MGILWTIIIGVLAGFIAGKLMNDKGFGFIVNFIVGLAGSFIGNWVCGLLGISLNTSSIIGSLLCSVGGAICCSLLLI